MGSTNGHILIRREENVRIDLWSLELDIEDTRTLIPINECLVFLQNDASFYLSTSLTTSNGISVVLVDILEHSLLIIKFD